MKESDGLIRTPDLGKAAYLLAHGEQLVATEREESGRKLTFCFAPSPTISERDNAFINGGQVEARAYFHTIRDLKKMAVGE